MEVLACDMLFPTESSPHLLYQPNSADLRCNKRDTTSPDIVTTPSTATCYCIDSFLLRHIFDHIWHQDVVITDSTDPFKLKPTLLFSLFEMASPSHLAV